MASGDATGGSVALEVNGIGDLPEGAVRGRVAAEMSRRELLKGTGVIALAAVVAGALPTLSRLASPPVAAAADPLSDATLQAFFDTLIPGRVVSRTVSGQAIAAGAIAGVDPEPGAVEADALLLAHDPRIGFDALIPVLFAELESRSLGQGGTFVSLPYERRETVCLAGLDFGNPTRTVWEAGAAVAFTAFCAAATVVNARAADAPGLRVMGDPGTAPNGWRGASYKRRLARGRTKTGNLP
jgi:hypothetical protein